MDQSAQKGPGRDDHGAGRKFAAVRQADPGDPIACHVKVVGLAFNHAEIGGLANRRLHRRGIKFSVGLGSWSADGRTLAAIEHAELDAAGISHPAHQSVQGIDLADQMALTEAADGGVAGHRADGRKTVGDQGSSRAHAGSSSRGFTAGVATADDDDVERFRGRGHGPDFYRGVVNPRSGKCRI